MKDFVAMLLAAVAIAFMLIAQLSTSERVKRIQERLDELEQQPGPVCECTCEHEKPRVR